MRKMTLLSRRIIKETQRLVENPVPGISAIPDDSNARYFHVMISGPNDSPYEGGAFKLELFLPKDYPMAAPKVRFITKIYHPNIDRLGRICLDILKDKWTPALQIRTVLLSIQALLSAPNPDDPLENDTAELWKSNEALAIENAREWTRQYAMQELNLDSIVDVDSAHVSEIENESLTPSFPESHYESAISATPSEQRKEV